MGRKGDQAGGWGGGCGGGFCEFLSSVAPSQPGSRPPACTPPPARTSLSVVSTSVLSLERTSLTCTRIWKAGQAVSGASWRASRPPRPRGDQTGQEMLLGGGRGRGEEGAQEAWPSTGLLGTEPVTRVGYAALKHQDYFTGKPRFSISLKTISIRQSHVG